MTLLTIFRPLFLGTALSLGLTSLASAACSDTSAYSVTLYNAPGQSGYEGATLTVDQMVAMMGGYGPLLQNLRYVADMDRNTYGGPSGQQIQQQVNRAIAAVVACQQAQERSRADAKAASTAPGGPAGAPAANGPAAASLYNTEDNADGNQLIRQVAAAGAPFSPKNPQQNHTGEPCVFFTAPLVRADGGGLNAYADESYVAYGKYYYVCRNRRWVSVGPASAFVNVQEHAAETLERRTLSTHIFEKE